MHAPRAAAPASFVLILKTDRDAGASLRRHVLTVLPAARCIVVHTVVTARAALAAGAPDLFVTGLEAPDGDPLDLLWLASAGPRPPRRIFVVTRHREPWLHTVLRGLPICGVLDSTYDAPEMISVALREILHGRRYFSLSLQQAQAVPGAKELRLRQLTPTERVVFAAIGDGRQIKAVAAWLGLSANAIKAALEALRGKLGAGSLSELTAMAARYGFIRTVPAGFIRVGFGRLLADYYLRSQRPMPPTHELRAEYPEATALAGSPSALRRVVNNLCGTDR